MNNFDVIDAIYQEERNELHGNMETLIKQRTDKKSFAHQQLQRVEERALHLYEAHKNRFEGNKVADLNYDVASGDKIAELNEKLGGRFRLKLSSNLSAAKKFERFAEESSAFHLHKKRIFIKKVLETF